MSQRINLEELQQIKLVIESSEINVTDKTSLESLIKRTETLLKNYASEIARFDAEILHTSQQLETAVTRKKSKDRVSSLSNSLETLKRDKAKYENKALNELDLLYGKLRSDTLLNTIYKFCSDTETSDLQTQIKALSNLKLAYDKAVNENTTLTSENANCKNSLQKLRSQFSQTETDKNFEILQLEIQNVNLEQSNNHLQQLISDRDTLIEELQREVPSNIEPDSFSNTSESLEMANQELIDALKKVVQTSKIEINRFKGSPREAINWLDEYEFECDCAGWNTPELKLEKINLFLKDTARDWFEANKNKFTNWDVFKIEFRKHYLPDTHKQTLQKIVFESKQGAFEPIVNYIDKKRKFCRKFNRNMTDEEQIGIIVQNMLPEIKTRLKPFSIQTIDDLIEKAKIIEECLKEDNEIEINNIVVKDKSDEISELKSLVEKLASNLKTQNENKTKFNKFKFTERTSDGRPYCTFCRIPGHAWQNCRNRQMSSFNHANRNYNRRGINRGNFKNNRQSSQNNNLSRRGNQNYRVFNQNRNTARNATNTAIDERSERNINEESYELCAVGRRRSLITVPAYVDEHKIKALIDTGASMTLVSEKLANLVQKPIFANTTYSPICANSTPIQTIGIIKVTVVLKRSKDGKCFKADIEAIVCRDLPSHCILGMNLIRQ